MHPYLQYVDIFHQMLIHVQSFSHAELQIYYQTVYVQKSDITNTIPHS